MWSRPEAEEAVRDRHAAAPDDGQATFRRYGRRHVRVRSRLEPDDLRADRDRIARDGLGLGWWTEHVDDVDRHVHVAQRCEHMLAEDVGLTPLIFQGAAEMYRLTARSEIGGERPETVDRFRGVDGTIDVLARASEKVATK